MLAPARTADSHLLRSACRCSLVAHLLMNACFMRLEEIMSTEVLTVAPDEAASDARGEDEAPSHSPPGGGSGQADRRGDAAERVEISP